MLGYIISDKEKIKVRGHKIFSFDVLCKTNLNIFVVENNKVLYDSCDDYFTYYAAIHGHEQVLT